MQDTGKVPSQKDVAAIVNAIVSNTTYANTVLDAVFSSITRISKAKAMEVKLADIQHVESIVVSYNKMINSIINVLCQDDNGQARDLHALLGAVKDDGKSTNDKVVLKYKTIDAAMQLPKVVESMFGLFDKLSEGSFGLKSLIKFRINIWKLKPMINGLFKDLLSVFASINPDKQMADIVACLVKQPDIIQQTNNIVQKGEFDKTDLSTTVTKQGQLGILDVFAKTFEIINSVNTLKTPNFASLKVKLFGIRIALGMILKDIIKWADKNLDTDAQIKIMYIEDAILGTENKKGIREGGLQGIIQALVGIFALTKRMKLDFASMIMVRLSLHVLGKIIDVILDMQPKFEALSNKTIMDNITNASKTFEKLKDIFKAIATIGLLSIVVIVFALPIMISMFLIAGIIWSLSLVIKVLTKANLDGTALDPLLDITKALGKIMLNMIILGLAAIPASLAVLIVAIFMVGLILFVGLVLTVSKIIQKMSKKVNKQLRSVLYMIATLMLISIAILVLALATPIIVEALEGNIWPFLLILATSMFTLWILMKMAAKFAQKASEDAIKLGVLVLMIAGALLICSVVLLILAKVSEQLTWESFGMIFAMLGGVIVLCTILVGLGLALTHASPFMAMSMAPIGIMVGLLGLLLLAALSIMTLSKIKLDFGKYQKPKKDGEIGSGSGVLGNTMMIFDFINILRKTLKENDLSPKDFRKSKRALKQVNKIVKRLNKIANNLNTLSKIKLDQALILDNVKNIFVFIKDLEDKINGWMNPNASTLNANATINQQQIADYKDRLSRKKRGKEMKQSEDKLNRVEKVLTVVVNIAKGLEMLARYTIDETVKNNIITNVQSIFAFIAELETQISTNLLADTITTSSGEKIETLSKRELRKSNKKMNRVDSIMSTMKNITDSLKAIIEIKLDESILKTIETNVTLIFGAITKIGTIVDTNMKQMNIDGERFEENIMPIINCINELTGSVKEFSEINPEKLSKTVDNYIRFVNSVNTMEVEKVTRATDMFRQMSEFSNSIKGDFDSLAESLGEKLLPVLEELKQVMSEVPETLQKGFRDTNASIGATATANAPTTEGVKEQLKRENPGMSDAELNKKVQERMAQQATSNAKGVEGKLDALLKLLQGIGGVVKVKL